jgi:AcrR family transcriptional regulator
MATSPRAERTEQRKREIILAALACFNERGYSETTMSLIRERAGASTGSIYHHFQNKDQLAAAIYLEGILDYQRGYVRELERKKTAKAGIETIARYHLGWVENNREWADYLNRMRHARFMSGSDPLFAKANSEFMGRVGLWFRPHVEAGRLKKLPREVLVAQLMGPLQEYTRMWLAGHADLKPRQAARHLAQAAWCCLKG